MTTQQGSVGEMIAQSRDVLANPSVPTFERYERRGTLSSAAIYVGIAAIVSGLLGLITSFLPGPPAPGAGGFIGGFISALVQFFVFTGLIFYLGRSFFGGSGSWDEVAYTFSLFTAPLIVVGAALAFVVSLLVWIPLLGGLVALLGALASIALLVVQVYYAYLAVQSSMNIRDPGRSALLLVISFIVTAVVMGLVAWVF
ncbi:MAG: YIP1 family protein [Chloroflexi bacterium OHK40]